MRGKMKDLAAKASAVLGFSGCWDDDQTTREIGTAEHEAEAIQRLEQITLDALRAGEVVRTEFFEPWISDLRAAKKEMGAAGRAFLNGWIRDIERRFPIRPRLGRMD